MASSGNGSYHVSCAQAVGNQLRRLKRVANRQGRGESFTLACKRLLKDLRDRPLAVGEPLYVLHHLGLQVRATAAAPLVVEYAVDERRGIVYLKVFKLLAAPKGLR